MIDNVPHIIKLYFKDDSLSKSRVDMVLFLMDNTLKTHAKKNSVMGILDVMNSKLIVPNAPLSDLNILLLGEAQSFMTIWNNI